MLPECAELLRDLWQALPSATSPLAISLPQHREQKRHLCRAKIERLDDHGRQLDFHALRYTFCSMLGGKLPIQLVRVLMRHRDIHTTANLYLDLGIAHIAEQLPALPRIFG
jgi:integrase